MGCDIHFYVEKKIDNSWMPVKADRHSELTYRNWAYSGRDYHLFSYLADVRSYGRGDCLAEPRGLPEDVSPEIGRESDEYGLDGHSHSHFTLEELIAGNSEVYNQDFNQHTIPKLKELAQGDHTSVRVVFWFDN
jgi:hypothetical protein